MFGCFLGGLVGEMGEMGGGRVGGLGWVLVRYID